MTGDQRARSKTWSGDAAAVPDAASESRALFDRIGAFLADQRLDPTPANYDFAYRVLSEPHGALAQAVRALVDRGVRLAPSDVESLMRREVQLGALSAWPLETLHAQADGLMARTRMQIEEFEVTVRTMLAETQGLGRDLATATAAAIHGGEAGGPALFEAPAAIAAAMLERLYHAEWRLEQARQEAGELRGALGAAQADARCDPLTGLANRRAFAEAFERAAGTTRVMAICDVDHFKAINDRFGHGVGDSVLKGIAASLQAAFGEHLVARYGGEEFAVLFTGTNLDAAFATVEAARERIAANRFELGSHGGMSLRQITISAGLVQAEPGEGLEAVYWRADSCLYLAKTQGRNSVVCA
ncbi:diguanylate cyclase [Sphingomonas sp. ac-8]|uniref:GGDEF domain-containing protein n=1 Tax=Sphingomonas sp. ac-8 TaxID=3242977 RepID=UPI003A80A626